MIDRIGAWAIAGLLAGAMIGLAIEASIEDTLHTITNYARSLR